MLVMLVVMMVMMLVMMVVMMLVMMVVMMIIMMVVMMGCWCCYGWFCSVAAVAGLAAASAAPTRERTRRR